MKKMKLIGMMVAVAMLAGGLRASVIYPTSDTLANLVSSGGSLGIGDKIFSGFGYQESGLTSFDANNISVTASIEGGVYYLTWGGIIALASAGGPEVGADLLLNYDVTAVGGQIVMIDQMYTGSAQGRYSDSYVALAVDESVYDGQTVVAFSRLQVGDLSDPYAEAGDDLLVQPGKAKLHITKDIGLTVVNGGFVSISSVRQSFHQRVPDGGMTVAMLGLALAGLGIARRRLS
jgi:hypothetical protein